MPMSRGVDRAGARRSRNRGPAPSSRADVEFPQATASRTVRDGRRRDDPKRIGRGDRELDGKPVLFAEPERIAPSLGLLDLVEEIVGERQDLRHGAKALATSRVASRAQAEARRRRPPLPPSPQHLRRGIRRWTAYDRRRGISTGSAELLPRRQCLLPRNESAAQPAPTARGSCPEIRRAARGGTAPRGDTGCERTPPSARAASARSRESPRSREAHVSRACLDTRAARFDMRAGHLATTRALRSRLKLFNTAATSLPTARTSFR